MNRRRFLGVCGAVGTTAGAGCVGRDWESSRGAASEYGSERAIGLDTVAEGLSQPLDLVDVPGRDLTYIADKVGRIRILDENGVRGSPLLDISDQLAEAESWEQGLLGLAVHPNFEANRRFYVRYSAPLREGMPDDYSHAFVLSEFRATEDATGTVADSERVVLELPQPGRFHQAGAITFGPDGYLYVAVGDGGTSEDAAFKGYLDTGPGHAEDWYPLNRGGNGQNLTDNLLGSILRIDVDDAADGEPYAIPESNPLVGERGLDEQYAWGFRNPYRMSFDRGRLFVGDVGFQSYEEINLVEKGGNYGWNVREGSKCVNANTALRGGLVNDVPDLLKPLFEVPPLSILDNYVVKRFFPGTFDQSNLPACPQESPRGTRLSDPLVVYPYRRDGEQTGSAVIGGYVYRGSGPEWLTGQYVFGDLMLEGSGRMFVADPDGSNRPREMRELTVAGSESGRLDEAILSFGRDRDGELYVLTTLFSEGTGTVYRLTSPD